MATNINPARVELTRTDIINNRVLDHLVDKHISQYQLTTVFIKELNTKLDLYGIDRQLFVTSSMGLLGISAVKPIHTTSLMRFIKFLINRNIIVNNGSYSFVLDLNDRFYRYGSNIQIIPTLGRDFKAEYSIAEIHNRI